MNEEKWFTADEAVEFGFANSVKRAEPQEEPQDIASMIQDAVAVAMANLSQPVTNQVEQEPILFFLVFLKTQLEFFHLFQIQLLSHDCEKENKLC